jgi:flagellar biosynthesis protein FlhB
MSATEKTEKPTGKKLGEARKRGKIAKSNDLNSVSVLLVGALITYGSGGRMVEHFRALLQELWGQGFHEGAASAQSGQLMQNVALHFFSMLGPVCLGALVAAFAINLIQTKGLMIATEALKPDFAKLNPFTGLKKFVSIRSLLELVKSVLKIFIISYAIYGVLRSNSQLISGLTDLEITEMAKVLGELAFKMVFRVAFIMLFLAIIDFVYQKWQYSKDLRMSKHEVKEESKQSEGNPQVKGRIRSLQRSMARQRMMSAVPKASVVITNPTHYAVAILYGPQLEAPQIVAKGMDLIAKKIIQIAREHKVPVVQNPPLARALYKQVKLEATIPVALYKAVAKVLAYVYQQKRRQSQAKN